MSKDFIKTLKDDISWYLQEYENEYMDEKDIVTIDKLQNWIDNFEEGT